MFGYLVAIALLMPAPRASHVHFIVAGDDRIRLTAEGALRPTDNGATGINEGVLGPMLDKIAAAKPDFVLYTGDLVSGWDAKLHDSMGLPDMTGQLNGWVDFIGKHNPGGIPYFPVRGNHETRVGTENADAAWKLSKISSMLRASSSKVKHFVSDGFNFAFDAGGCSFVAVDAYSTGKNVADIPWLTANLKGRAKTLFAYAHPMCFFAGGHKDHFDGANRDDLLNLLEKSGCRNFFSGHDHFYDRVSILRDNVWRGVFMTQWVCGTAGAPFYKKNGDLPDSEAAGSGDPYVLRRVGADHIENTYGYVDVDVVNGVATIKFVPMPVTGGTMPVQ